MIIALNGYAKVGKDEIANIIKSLHPIWEVKKFAGKLKHVASIITGIPEEKFEDQDFKKTYLPEQWNYWTVSVIDNGKMRFQQGRYNSKEEADGFVPFLKESHGVFRMEYVVGMQQMTVRQFLQELGTDSVRNGLHPNAWVNALMADYRCVPADRAPNGWDCPNCIITDCRFPNEAKAVKRFGGKVIRVNRPGIGPINNHPSEIALDDWDFDAVIENDGTLEDLKFKALSIL